MILAAAEAALAAATSRREAAEEAEGAARQALREIQRTHLLPPGWVWEKDVRLVDGAPAVQAVETATGRRGQWDGRQWYHCRQYPQATPPWL